MLKVWLLLPIAIVVFVLATSFNTNAQVPCGKLELEGHTYRVCRDTPTPVPTATPEPRIPSIITESGTYRGKATSSTGHCIEVRASNVIIENAVISPCKGRGITASNVTNLTVRNSYISTQYAPSIVDAGDGIYAFKVDTLLIEGNTFEKSQTNIEVQGSNNITIRNNVMKDPLGPYPRGQHIQIWPEFLSTGGFGPKPINIDILNNTMSCIVSNGCHQEDAINLGSLGNGLVDGNSMTGGYSGSGCGLILEANTEKVTVSNNLADGQQCGFGMAGGFDNRFENNIATHYTNIGFYGEAYNGICARITYTDNKVGPRPDNTYNDFWYNPARCSTITSNGWTRIP